MKPDPEHVEPLKGFSAFDFAAWLRRGFEDLYYKDMRVTAFAPLNYFVGRQDDITRELKNIYDALPKGTVQEKFRLGIAVALTNLPPTLQSVPTVRELLHLAARVHAPEVLPEVIKQVGNGFFGLPEHNECRELFALTLNIVGGMSPAKGVGENVRGLVGSSYFRPGYAPTAFIALCRAEPEKFHKHLELLRGYFAALHREAGMDNIYLTARRFAQFVDLSLIQKNLWQLYLSLRPGTDLLSTDNWLVKALINVEKAPFLLDKEGDCFYIARRDREQTQEKWKILLPEKSVELWTHLDDVRYFLNKCLEGKGKEMLENIDIEKVFYSLPIYVREFQPQPAVVYSLLVLNSPLFPPLYSPERVLER